MRSVGKSFGGKVIIIVLSMVITIFLVIIRWFADSRGQLKAGQSFPKIELQKTDKSTFNFPDYDKSIKIVYLYKFRCSLCRQYLVKLVISQRESVKKLLHKYLILISLDSEKYWKLYSSKLKINGLVCWDYKQAIVKVSGSFQIPTILVIKGDIIRSVFRGHDLKNFDIQKFYDDKYEKIF